MERILREQKSSRDWEGCRGVWKPQNRTEIRQKTANRIFFPPKTETARTWRPQYENRRPQDL